MDHMQMSDFTWVRITLAVAIHVVVLLVSAWDILALSTHHPELTVSSLVQEWARVTPILGVVVGALVGHLFWPVR